MTRSLMMLLALAACTLSAPEARMTAAISSHPAFGLVIDQCPLDVYATRTDVPGAVADCAADPAACLQQCSDGNAQACFDAAQVIENGTEDGTSQQTFPLYMAGCALGDSNACVNAGATVKNGAWPGPRPQIADGDSCQLRTYRQMCEDGAAWGCYMTAQEYRTGSSVVAQSEARYESFMRRACAISTSSGACLWEFRP